MNDALITTTKAFVQQILQNAEGGHDWQHISRVYKTAMKIAAEEPCNKEVVALAALLHDIADSKFHNGDEAIGAITAQRFLQENHVDDATIEAVVQIIQNISFKGGKEKRAYASAELDIVQDADRLDAIGAIGIARAFNYGGFKNRKIYDPEILPNLDMDKETYKKNNAPTINHFYEKLLLLKDLMNTTTGKRLAAERHRFMESFLEHFFEEAGEKEF